MRVKVDAHGVSADAIRRLCNRQQTARDNVN